MSNIEIITISSDSDDDVKQVPVISSPKSRQQHSTSSNHDESTVADTSTEILLDQKETISEEGEAEVVKSEDVNKHNSDLTPEESLFNKFLSQCEPLLDDKRELSPKKIMSSLKTEHSGVSNDFKSSPEYTDMLLRALKETSRGSTNIYVTVNDVYTQLKRHCPKRKIMERENSNLSDDKQPKRVKLTKVLSEKSVPENDSKESAEPNTSNQDRSRKLDKRIKRLEGLLQTISNEIKRLQAHELSMEEMDKEDSSYIQEDKLKKRFMKVFERICELKKVSPRTGRLMESKIQVTTTRYPEVNKKVEKYVNKAKFPDFYAIQFLVKRASKQSNLFLQPPEVQKLSEDLFKEVGKKLQERRHYDFVYNFGSYLTDQKTAMEDPADDNEELQEKLKANRQVGKSAIDNVLEKFVQKQKELDCASQQSAKNAKKGSSNDEASKDSDEGSEPPSEPESEEEESEEGDDQEEKSLNESKT